ncbi:hypothetical protein [Halorussus salinisoli]|uniref:hypothetical protein n=1 Tax=Halorussus salinisoli TaxID=2558242 RepID=UPI0010C22A1F|nr:hypothetical protein [Halorussus salinisoli]
MKLGTRDTLLTAGTTVLLLVGVALILFADAMLTTVGIVLVIASAIVFLVDVKDLVVETDDRARK